MTADNSQDYIRTDNVKTMKKQKQTGIWPQGTKEFEAVLPAAVTKSGKPEKVKLSFSKTLVATKPLTEKGWVKWEIKQAKINVDKVAHVIDSGQPLKTLDVDDLDIALSHAISAWRQTHQFGKFNSAFEANRNAFFRESPGALKKIVLRAISALQRIEFGTVSPAEMLAAVRTATEALIKATQVRSAV